MSKPTVSKTLPGKPGFSVGVDFDHLAIRSVRLSSDGKGGHAIEGMADVTGDFSVDADLIEGLKQVKDRLKMGAKDRVVTCLSGKQVSASQLVFRQLPAEEMESALRIEMRKSIPFEIAGATLDYEVLGDVDAKAETNQVMVVLAGAGLLNRHLKVLEKASLAPVSVDVLPLAAANALWAWVGQPKSDAPHVAVHIGPQISTIVIDGARSPFFNRYVYFAAEDFIGKEPNSPDLEKRTQALAEEVARSLAFYEKSSFATGFLEVTLLGEYLDTPLLAERIRRQTGLTVRKMDIPKKMGHSHEFPPGRFDLALALALRAEED